MRIENAALRAALGQAQTQLGQIGQASASAQLSQTQPPAQQQDDQEDEKTETPTIKSDG